ncbi:hypothetical protein DFS34DRAFT_653703 [Phlyctochytrium arcticum]|nr:hypothetical protein DFS34DRAFT_653703 [Phlyctochytrium arcticum]
MAAVIEETEGTQCSRNNDVSAVFPNLFLSSCESATHQPTLSELGITHVVSIGLGFTPLFPKTLQYLILEVEDEEKALIIQHFDISNKFIHDALESNGRVLVHCVAGVSRSATLVLAYLMSHQNYSYQAALDYTQSRRSCVSPNPGFQRQLHIFEEMGNVLNKEHLTYRSLLLDLLGNNQNSSDPASASEPSISSAAMIPPNSILRCASCRKPLVPGTRIISHAPSVDASGPIRCMMYHIEPMNWISAIHTASDGRINCPNIKCAAKLGSWSWKESGFSDRGWVNNGHRKALPWQHTCTTAFVAGLAFVALSRIKSFDRVVFDPPFSYDRLRRRYPSLAEAQIARGKSLQASDARAAWYSEIIAQGDSIVVSEIRHPLTVVPSSYETIPTSPSPAQLPLSSPPNLPLCLATAPTTNASTGNGNGSVCPTPTTLDLHPHVPWPRQPIPTPAIPHRTYLFRLTVPALPPLSPTPGLPKTPLFSPNEFQEYFKAGEFAATNLSRTFDLCANKKNIDLSFYTLNADTQSQIFLEAVEFLGGRPSSAAFGAVVGSPGLLSMSSTTPWTATLHNNPTDQDLRNWLVSNPANLQTTETIHHHYPNLLIRTLQRGRWLCVALSHYGFSDLRFPTPSDTPIPPIDRTPPPGPQHH